MKKKVIPIVLILAVAVAVIAFRPSLAWINSVFAKSQNVSIAQLKYTFEGQLHAAYIDGGGNEFVAPGENLIYVGATPGVLKAFNLSAIPTNLRIRVDYSLWVGGVMTTVAYGDETSDFSVAFTVPANWEYDSVSKCWLYKPADVVGKPFEIKPFQEPVTLEGETTATPLAGDEMVLIDSLGYSTALTQGSIYETKNVNIRLTVEVKQAEFVDWTTVIDDVYNP